MVILYLKLQASKESACMAESVLDQNAANDGVSQKLKMGLMMGFLINWKCG